MIYGIIIVICTTKLILLQANTNLIDAKNTIKKASVNYMKHPY